MIEDYAAAMAETIRQHSEGGAVLLPNTRRGKLLAAKLGYRLSAAVSNDASDVSLQDGKAAVKHMVYGGLAIGAETIASPFAVITLSSGTFDAQQPDASRSGEMHTVQWQAPATAVTRTATRARQSNSVDLDKARLVVSGTRHRQQREYLAGRSAVPDHRRRVGLFSPGGGKREVDGARALRRYLQPDAQTRTVSGGGDLRADPTWSAPTARRRFSPSTKIKTRQSSSMRILASLAMR